MDILHRIRSYRLRKSMNHSYVPRPYAGFEELKVIGMVFEVSVAAEQGILLSFAGEMREAGKTVHLLGYIPRKRKEITAEYPFPWFCKSDINWWGAPSGEAVRTFGNAHFGALIDFTGKEEHPLDFVVASCAADFKIGNARRRHLDFDLVFRMNDILSHTDILEIEYYLHFINQGVKKQ